MSAPGGAEGARQLLRLAKTTPHFVSAEGLPTSALFEPSSEDEAQTPVLTSVWDHAVMPVARVRALLPDDHKRTGWTVTEASVAEVSELSVKTGRGTIEVVPDPEGVPPAAELSAAEKAAHFGLSGLSGAGLTRGQEKVRRNVLRELARRALAADPEPR